MVAVVPACIFDGSGACIAVSMVIGAVPKPCFGVLDEATKCSCVISSWLS